MWYIAFWCWLKSSKVQKVRIERASWYFNFSSAALVFILVNLLFWASLFKAMISFLSIYRKSNLLSLLIHSCFNYSSSFSQLYKFLVCFITQNMRHRNSTLQHVVFMLQRYSNEGVVKTFQGYSRTWNFFLLDNRTSRPKLLLVRRDFYCSQYKWYKFQRSTELVANSWRVYGYAHS